MITARPFITWFRFGLIGLCLFLFAFLLSGCSSVSTIKKKSRQLTRELPFTGDGLKRTLAIGVVENHTPYKRHAFEKQLKDRLSAALGAECPRILMPPAATDAVAKSMEDLRRQNAGSGRAMNLVLAEAGRKEGLNAVLTAAVVDISATRQDKGILWYKDTYTYLRVQVAVAVYDTETGAKLLDETAEYKTEVDELDTDDALRYEDLVLPSINTAIDTLALEAADRVCERLLELRWNGFVVAREGDRLVLSSGEAVGLKPGMVLEVFDDGSPIQGAQGQQFFLPGQKVGEARVAAVTRWQAEATLVSGEKVAAGHCVKLK